MSGIETHKDGCLENCECWQMCNCYCCHECCTCCSAESCCWCYGELSLDKKENVKDCPFCNMEEKRIVYHDEFVYAIQDRTPKSKYHFLVIPYKHIPNIHWITKDMEGEKLIQHMMHVGNTKLGLTKEKYQMGFHVPPFYSIDHLHMHVMSLPVANNFCWTFTPNCCFCFVSSEDYLRRISSSNSKLQIHAVAPISPEMKRGSYQSELEP